MDATGSNSASAGAVDLDRPMTIGEFAAWLGVGEGWVRKRLRLLPGVIIESRETVWIHPRTYLDGRLASARKGARP